MPAPQGAVSASSAASGESGLLAALPLTVDIVKIRGFPLALELLANPGMEVGAPEAKGRVRIMAARSSS